MELARQEASNSLAIYNGKSLLKPEIVHFDQGSCSLFTTRCPNMDRPNEDGILVLDLGSEKILAVADGVGGSKSGKLASKIALEALVEELERSNRTNQGLRHGILNGFESANSAVVGLKQGAGTTLVVAEVTEGTFRAYHAGDSLLLSVGQKGKLKYRTLDHSISGHACESGLVTQKESFRLDNRHLLTNLVGSEGMRIELGPRINLAHSDTLILATDGVSDNLEQFELLDCIRKGRLEDCGELLMHNCLKRMCSQSKTIISKPDDLSFIIYRN